MTLIVYRYKAEFPSTKAHSVQIAHTVHALARAGAEVWFYPARYDGGSPEEALAAYGLQPLPNLQMRLPLQWSKRSRRWKGRLIPWWENWVFGQAAKRRPVFYLRNGLDSYEYAQHLARKRQSWNARVVLEMHCVRSMELAEYSKPDAPAYQQAEVNDHLRGQAANEVPALKLADGIVVTGSTLGEAVREVCPGLGEFGLARNAASVAEADPAKELPLSARHGILYAGQFYAWKGLPTLIRAMAHLPGSILTLVGGNVASDVAAVRALASELGVLDQIRFTGQVPHSEVAGHLSQARCAVIPLGNDLAACRFTSPIKAFEYMAAGTPIVATGLPTVREILQHEHNALLAEPEDPESMAQQIKRILHDDALAERLRIQARADLGQYTWDMRAKRILEYIEKLPAPHDQRSPR